jgi:hypothetical protein
LMTADAMASAQAIQHRYDPRAADRREGGRRADAQARGPRSSPG